MKKAELTTETHTDVKPMLCNNYKKAIARYIPMQGYVAQMIDEKELRVIPIKSDRQLYRGEEIKGIEVEGFFIISS